MSQIFSRASWVVAAVIGIGGTFAGYYVLNQRLPSGEFVPGNIASGAQIILGAAVAAFALLQATISAQATRAARDAVTSTDRQTAVMREEAERSERHAQAAYQFAREERLDVSAPRVTLVCDAMQLWSPETPMGVVTREWANSARQAEGRPLAMQAKWSLSNHDSVPVRYEAQLVVADWVPIQFRPQFGGTLSGMLGPGEKRDLFAELLERPVTEWAAFADRAAQPGQQDVPWFWIQVKVVQASFSVMDTHNAWVRPPSIVTDETDGEVRYRVVGEPIQHARLAAIKRTYVDERLRALEAIADDWPQ